MTLDTALGRERASAADRDEPGHDKSAARAPGLRGASAFRGEAIPERPRRAAGLVSRLDRRAEEQWAAPRAVRQDSVSPEDAADCHRPWALRAKSLPPEVPPGEASAARPAYWEPFQPRRVAAGWQTPAVAASRAERVFHAQPVLPATKRAAAAAGRIESDRAWGPAESDGPELECHAVRRGASTDAPTPVLTTMADAAVPRGAQAAHPRESRGPAASPPPVRA